MTFARPALLLLALSCRGPSDDAVATKEGPKLPKPKPTVEAKLVAPKVHRPAAVACPSDDVPITTTAHGKMGPGPACTTKADCSPSSRCVKGHCWTDSCYADADCKGKGPVVCACDPNGAGHRCLEGDCRVDGDCAGGFCSPTFGLDCGSYSGVVAYRCHTKDDACLDDAECQKDGQTYGYCAFEPKSGHWVCGYGTCKG